jgi:polysaccharide pyruvyl transferase WcaK-like protein
MKVGLFGYYNFGNFGDDIMAFIISQHLKSKRIKFRIFGDPTIFRDQHNLNTTNSIKNLVDYSDIIIIGGGGCLIPRKDKYFTEYNNQIARLIELCKLKSTPLYAISIGGNGVPLKRIYPKPRRDLIHSIRYATFRNPRDLKLLNESKIKGHYYPDIAWLTPRFFQGKRTKTKKIGINIMPSKNILFRFILDIIIKTAIKKNRDYEFIFIDTRSKLNLDRFNTFHLKGKYSNCSKRKFHQLNEDIEFIKSLDLLITSRLHIGIIALAYNIPVISFLPKIKTKHAFKNVGLHHLLWGIGGLFNLIYYFSSKKRLRKLLNSLSHFNSTPIINNAEHHLKELDSIITRNENLQTKLGSPT